MLKVVWNPLRFPDYRGYGSRSTGIWSLRWLFLYLHSYNLVGSITIPFTIDDDADGTGCGGSLSTAATGAIHLAIIIGPIVGSALGAPRRERVSCIIPLPLAVHGWHVRWLSGPHFDGLWVGLLAWVCNSCPQEPEANDACPPLWWPGVPLCPESWSHGWQYGFAREHVLSWANLPQIGLYRINKKAARHHALARN
jgi:hypothetical protein